MQAVDPPEEPAAPDAPASRVALRRRSSKYAGTVITPRIRCYPALDNMLIPILMITALGMIVALFPAWRLRKLRPVDVLREV